MAGRPRRSADILPRASLYRNLPTEKSHPRSRNLDLKPTLEILRLMNQEDAGVAGAVRREFPRIAQAVGIIVKGLSAGKRLFFVGAGTSGRLGVLEAAECPPTFGIPPHVVYAIMAGGRAAVFQAREGAEDQVSQGAHQVMRRVRPGDVVVGIAASGVTPFVRGALGAVKGRGCPTILVTSNARSLIREADCAIAPKVGSEILSGSTRLKSATAAKMILNMLTTASMIRLGKVYDGYMVDMKITSWKLKARALRMLCHLGHVPPAKASSLLTASHGHVKTAVLMARRGLSEASARKRLVECGGSLRKALRSHASR